MKTPRAAAVRALADAQDAAWRDPAATAFFAREATATDPRLLASEVRGDFWEVVRERRLTLLVSREYEHLLIGLSAHAGTPRISYFPLPHPSGIAVDRSRRVVHVASSRNPNQVYSFVPVSGSLPRRDSPPHAYPDRPLVPVSALNYPGCVYLHDLAFVGPTLVASSTGQNAIVRLEALGRTRPVWWPRCVESRGRPRLDRNEIQLNSVAAGTTLRRSYFTASSSEPGSRRPGSRRFAVDGRGVVFSGETRAPVIRGLTRPHSARLHQRRLWVANSGYGELVTGELAAGGFGTVARLPGWTRGLCVVRGVAFVGTSRLLPRFEHYAPGVDARRARCGVHAVEVRSGRVLGSLLWPWGNQIFAVEPIPSSWSRGFAFLAGRRPARARERDLFYAFRAGDP